MTIQLKYKNRMDKNKQNMTPMEQYNIDGTNFDSQDPLMMQFKQGNPEIEN